MVGGAAGVPNAVVINSDLADDQRDLQVGSDVVLDINDAKATWHVVGVVSTESRGPAVYVSRDDYAYATRAAGQGRPGAGQHRAWREPEPARHGDPAARVLRRPGPEGD